ncbi:MAG: carbohydrate kinase family protein, partial [Spirochaetia bacterium]
GERTFLHCYGANGAFTDEDVDYEILKKSKIVFVGGFMLMPEFDGEACARVLKRAKALGKYTALDTAWDTKERWMDALRPSLAYIDLFIPSYEEAVMFCNKTEPEEIADFFLETGVQTIVIKLGEKGCFVKNETGQKYAVPAYKNIKTVDTTGAGDSFVAGFLTGLLKGMNLYECGKFANAVGAHCVMEVGASTGIKSYDEIQVFMNNYQNNVL